MKLKSFIEILIFVLIVFPPLTVGGETHSVSLEYNRAAKFPDLWEKIGPTLGIAPFRDQRSEKLYIGHYTSRLGRRAVSTYLKSEPIPLETAIQQSLSKAVSLSGVETVSIPNWDGKPQSLKDMKVDSVLTINIKRFWIEGRGILFQTNVNTSVHLVFRLGVKKLGQVFTQNVFVEKNRPLSALTSQEMAQSINRTLENTLDSFLQDPY